MKIPPTELRFKNKAPPKLRDLLDEILDSKNSSEEHLSFLEAIEKAKKDNHEGRANSDEVIKVGLQRSSEPRKDVYYEAYIQYLGMTFYYDEISKPDAAWYYYAQSRYYKGLFDSWDAVLLHIESQNQKYAARVKGGKQKAAKQTSYLKEAFIRVITESKPVGGWKDKKELLNAAIPILEEIRNAAGDDCHPLPENLIDVAKRWLRADEGITKAYLDNASDFHEALDKLSDHSSDPNHDY